MKQMSAALLIAGALFVAYPARAAETPAYQVSVVQSAAKAINYRDLKGSVGIDFKGTVLLTDARGTAVIRNRDGVTEVKAKFENLTAASQFGPEYLTYILWAISPDGRATNLGELIVKGGKSSLSAKIPLQAMSLIVTAEPYFAVAQPSIVVIMENAVRPGSKAKISLIDARYELLPRGQYTKNISEAELKPQVMDKKTPFVVYQARNAVRIARAAGAEAYAADAFKNSERLLALSEKKEAGSKNRCMTAREAVQSAEDSRAISLKRQAAEGIMVERQEAKDQISNANSEAAAAASGQEKAEAAQANAEQAKGKSDVERTEALALATSAVASSASSQADAKAARASAETAKGQAVVANNRAQKAEGEKAVLRAQLFAQLNSILQTQDTARGLIVNMPDALFKTGSSELQPQVREKLAKIAGILSSNPGLKLETDGYTDSVGGDEYNQQLSEKRAQSSREYLVSQGVPAKSIQARGFGKSEPIESNETSQGRQRNRRVELVVSGDAIGSPETVK